MDVKNIYMLKEEYMVNKNLVNYIFSIIIDIVFLIIFPIVIYFIGYKNYINNVWKIIIMISVCINVLLMMLSIIIKHNKKNTIIISEGNKYVFVKGYSDDIKLANGTLTINNTVLRNRNDIYSAILGLIKYKNDNSKLYRHEKQKLYIDLNKNYTINDIIDDLSLSYKYYENCNEIKKTNNYILYEGEKMKTEDETVKSRFKITKEYKSIFDNEVSK